MKPIMDKDEAANVFKTLAQKEPYFTVSSEKRFRMKNLDSERVDEFVNSGIEHADIICNLSGQSRFSSVLEYGCGLGRILNHMAKRADKAFGIDISPVMAQKVTQGNITGIEAPNWWKQAPDVELAYSYIVFQHIPEEEGLRILANLLKHCKIAVMHIVVEDERSPLMRLVWWLTFRKPFSWAFNAIKSRELNEPRIPMFMWNKEKIVEVFKANGFPDVKLTPNRFDGFLAYFFVGKK